ERACRTDRAVPQSVRVSFVVEQLIFKADGASAVITHIHPYAGFILTFLKEIIDAAIAARRHAPLETKIEIREQFGSHYVAAAAAGTPVAFGVLETSRLNAPAF